MLKADELKLKILKLLKEKEMSLGQLRKMTSSRTLKGGVSFR